MEPLAVVRSALSVSGFQLMLSRIEVAFAIAFLKRLFEQLTQTSCLQELRMRISGT